MRFDAFQDVSRRIGYKPDLRDCIQDSVLPKYIFGGTDAPVWPL